MKNYPVMILLMSALCSNVMAQDMPAPEAKPADAPAAPAPLVKKAVMEVNPLDSELLSFDTGDWIGYKKIYSYKDGRIIKLDENDNVVGIERDVYQAERYAAESAKGKKKTIEIAALDPLDPNLVSYQTGDWIGYKKEFVYKDGRKIRVDENNKIVSVTTDNSLAVAYFKQQFPDAVAAAEVENSEPAVSTPVGATQPAASGYASFESNDSHASTQAPGITIPRYQVKSNLPATVLTFKGMGGITEAGAVGGVGFGVKGHIAESTNASSGMIDIVGGKPVLRIKATGEVLPINVTTAVIGASAGFGSASGTVFKLVFTPVSAAGTLSLNKLGGEGGTQLGRSNITLTPEIAGRLLHVTANTHGAFVLNADLKAGLALGYAKDGNGASPIAGPSLGTGIEAEVIVAPQHSIAAGAQFKYIPSLLDTMKDAYRVGGEAKYKYTAPSGAIYFAGAQVETERFNVIPKGGANTDSGQVTFVGATLGVSIK